MAESLADYIESIEKRGLNNEKRIEELACNLLARVAALEEWQQAEHRNRGTYGPAPASDDLGPDLVKLGAVGGDYKTYQPAPASVCSLDDRCQRRPDHPGECAWQAPPPAGASECSEWCNCKAVPPPETAKGCAFAPDCHDPNCYVCKPTAEPPASSGATEGKARPFPPLCWLCKIAGLKTRLVSTLMRETETIKAAQAEREALERVGALVDKAKGYGWTDVALDMIEAALAPRREGG